jgi:hypothetical protein
MLLDHFINLIIILLLSNLFESDNTKYKINADLQAAKWFNVKVCFSSFVNS